MLRLPCETGVRLIIRARDAERDEWLRREWVALLPWMQAGHLKLIQLNDYIDSRTGKNLDLRPTEEIIAELEALHGRRLV